VKRLRKRHLWMGLCALAALGCQREEPDDPRLPALPKYSQAERPPTLSPPLDSSLSDSPPPRVPTSSELGEDPGTGGGGDAGTPRSSKDGGM